MNLSGRPFHPAGAVQTAGYLLVEYLLYIGVTVVVMGVAFSAFYRSLEHSRDLARNSDEILRTLAAGEQWRADIGAATAPPTLVSEDAFMACEIPTTNGLIAYVHSDSTVWRKQGEAEARPILQRIGKCLFLRDQRQYVTSWRWEIELRSKKKVPRVRPLFTFQAVPRQFTP